MSFEPGRPVPEAAEMAGDGDGTGPVAVGGGPGRRWADDWDWEEHSGVEADAWL